MPACVQQAHPKREQWAHKRDRQGRKVDAQLELQELLDVLIQCPPPVHSANDAAEVVVDEHNVTCLLGDVSAAQSHRDTHVSCPERWRIVGPVARDRHDMAEGLKDLDQALLLHGFRAGKHLETRSQCTQLVIAHGLELFAGQQDARRRTRRLPAWRRHEPWQGCRQ